jgi:CRP-like cAMP-binding protein
MLQTLYSYINRIHPVSEEVMQAIGKYFEIVETPKRQVLLKDGETCQYLYLVLDGVMRMYYIKDDEEVSSLFIEENYFFTAQSFYSRTPGYEYIDAIVPSKLARIHYTQLQSLYKEYPELNFIARVITENYLVKGQERLFLLRRQTAEERYIYFTGRYPTLLQRVPLKYIASYLGLTLETLSRIRNKIRK